MSWQTTSHIENDTPRTANVQRNAQRLTRLGVPHRIIDFPTNPDHPTTVMRERILVDTGYHPTHAPDGVLWVDTAGDVLWASGVYREVRNGARRLGSDLQQLTLFGDAA
jgi:hypothetical protein